MHKVLVLLVSCLVLFSCSPAKNNSVELFEYFKNNQGRLMDKWHHYFEIYERHLKKYRGKEVTLVEIGVYHGGSLQMFKKYLGPKARIIGIDIDPRCKQVEEEQFEVYIGDQADPEFLKSLMKKNPKIDIVIDDGGHRMNQQITSFQYLYPHLQDNGTYLCEDLHTSYWKEYGGGYKQKSTFIEMSKGLIDELNAHHKREETHEYTSFTESTDSLHFYDSVLVIEKIKREHPTSSKTGKPSF